MGCERWFIDAYRARGIEFDRIIAWEAVPVDHHMLWRSAEGYPPELHSRVTYYNTPISDDAVSADNPLNHIAALAREEDWVVFKLDVDNNPLEISLVRQLLASPSLLALVDEFFWEHHVRGSPLQKTRVSFMGTNNIGWGVHTPRVGDPDSTLADSYRLLTALREAGVRAHAWI
jgi:hypothetical protein